MVMLGFDESRWNDPTHPALAALDAVTPRPLVIHRADGHMALANSAALDAAGIRSDQEGVERDAEGEPTGRVTRDAVERLGRWAFASIDDNAIQELQLSAAGAGRVQRRDRGSRDVHAALAGAARPPGVPRAPRTPPDGRDPGRRHHGYPADHGPGPAVRRRRPADGRLYRRPDRGADGTVRRLRRERDELSRRRRARDVLPRRPHGGSAGGRPCDRRPGDRAGPRRVGTGVRRARFTRTPAFPRAAPPHRTLRDGEHVADRARRDARLGGVGSADVRPALGAARGDVRDRDSGGTARSR